MATITSTTRCAAARSPFSRSAISQSRVPSLRVTSSRAAAADAAAALYRDPARSMQTIGITGTNGKTTTATLLRWILERDHRACAFLGTLGYSVAGRELPAPNTTPDSVMLQGFFRELLDAGVRYCSMEVSSIALEQDRVRGVPFAAAIFTNLTHDHLDYHKTFDNHLRAKKRLFDALEPNAIAVGNAQDPATAKVLADTKGRRVLYGIDGAAFPAGPRGDRANLCVPISTEWISSCARRISRGRGRSSFKVSSPLLGNHNVQNVLAAASAALALGVAPESIVAAIETMGMVQGRLEAGRRRQAVPEFSSTMRTPPTGSSGSRDAPPAHAPPPHCGVRLRRRPRPREAPEDGFRRAADRRLGRRHERQSAPEKAESIANDILSRAWTRSRECHRRARPAPRDPTARSRRPHTGDVILIAGKARDVSDRRRCHLSPSTTARRTRGDRVRRPARLQIRRMDGGAARRGPPKGRRAPRGPRLIVAASPTRARSSRDPYSVALRGARFDGNAYALDCALAQGAAAALVETGRAPSEAQLSDEGLAGPRRSSPTETSPQRAPRHSAANYRRAFAIPVIGIGGATGKTTLQGYRGPPSLRASASTVASEEILQ